VETQQNAWCPPNFEMIGLAMAMKMQTKRHLLSSRCVSFKNTFLASPRSPPFFEDKSPAFIHSLFQQGNGTNNNPKGQAKKIPYAGTPREGNGRAAKYTQTRLHRIDGFRPFGRSMAMLQFCMTTANFGNQNRNPFSIKSSVRHILCFIPSSSFFSPPLKKKYVQPAGRRS